MTNIIKNNNLFDFDYSNYRTHFLYNRGLSNVIFQNLAVEKDFQNLVEKDFRAGDTMQFQNSDCMDAFVSQKFNSSSLIYAGKDGYRIINADSSKGGHVSNLLDYLGIEITKKGFENPQKLSKRIKRLFRQTRFGWIESNSIKIENRQDPEGNFDGIHFISTRYLKSRGVKASEFDRFSITFILNGLYYKGHALALNLNLNDIITYGDPIGELDCNGTSNFIQLDPVVVKDTVRMDIQSLTSIWAKGWLSDKKVAELVQSGLDSIEEGLTNLPKTFNNMESQSKLMKLGLHEVSIMLPRIVAMKWTQSKMSLLEFEKFRFPLVCAEKGYASIAFEYSSDGKINPTEGSGKLKVQNGNLFIPKSMVKKFKSTHGGADWDDSFNLLWEDKDSYIVWRSPNQYNEIAKYHIELA